MFCRWQEEGSPQALNGQGAKKSGVWETQQRLAALRQQFATHPANENSSAFVGDPTDAQVAELEKIRGDIAGFESQLAEVGK